MTFFSVIIPAFNRAHLLKDTLDSILKQEFRDFEIIVVDDGSTDNTYDILTGYQDKIKILHQENRGPGAARNLGINHAKGKYIAFLDSDDLWFPWTLKIYNQIICETDYPAFLAGNSIFFSNESELQGIFPKPVKIHNYSDYYTSSHESLWIGTCSAVIRAEILRQVGGFTEQWINAEDSDLWLKLGTAKGFIFIESPSLFAYRQHSNTAVTNHAKTYQGSCYLIQQEKTGQYPGAKLRQRERLEILTRHIRPVSFACLRHGYIQEGWTLYQDTLKWHLYPQRIRYLLGFPLIASLARLSKFSKFINNLELKS